jgi:hypothetical protein
MTKSELLAQFEKDTSDLHRSPITDPMSTRQADMYESYCRGLEAATEANKYTGAPPLVREPLSKEAIHIRDSVHAAFKRGNVLYVYINNETRKLSYRTKPSKTLKHCPYTTYIGWFLTKEEATKILTEKYG